MVKASKPVVRLRIRTAFGNRNAGVGGASSNSDDKEAERIIWCNVLKREGIVLWQLTKGIFVFMRQSMKVRI